MPHWGKKYSQDAKVMWWAGKAAATLCLSKANTWMVGKVFYVGIFTVSPRKWGTSKNRALLLKQTGSREILLLPLRDYTIANQTVDQAEKHVREQDVSFRSLLSNRSSENLVIFYIWSSRKYFLLQFHGSETCAKRVTSNGFEIQIFLQRFPERSCIKKQLQGGQQPLVWNRTRIRPCPALPYYTPAEIQGSRNTILWTLSVSSGYQAPQSQPTAGSSGSHPSAKPTSAVSMP